MRRSRGRNNKHQGDAKKIVESTLTYRIDKILDIAVKSGHDGIVLGAFGCGVYANDPNMISNIFADLLATKYYGRFKRIKFAVLEFSKKQRVFDAFHYNIKRRFDL